MTEAPGQPNRVRAVRDAGAKYAVYLDPEGDTPPEYVLYDLERDPDGAQNLVDHRTGEARTASAERLRSRLAERLDGLSSELGTELAGAGR